MQHQPIRLRNGTALPITIAQYDADRPALRPNALRAVCHAPFLSMDFDPEGSVRLCNHSHTAVARLTPEASVLEIWRGAGYERYRSDFANYVLDQKNCPHCVRQCEAGNVRHVFATEQFDRWANEARHPPYPKRLIFRLNSTCNFACVMCDDMTSSRIRKERLGLPPLPSAYGERFFAEMEEILPHVEHLEFYGGEPFLVREHQRIFDILQRIGARCTIYVNTNATSFHPAARKALETLNFVEIAVSMDAVTQDLHANVRRGMDQRIFLRNFEYLLELRQRRGVRIGLNVTEHRKNWFELPEIFRFAEQHQVPLHINTCLHPHNVTLYTLPDDQLRYVLAFLRRERAAFAADFPASANLVNYDFLLSLPTTELQRRGPDWTPARSNINSHSDGLLAAPVVGSSPFVAPQRVLEEAQRMLRNLGPEVAIRMIGEMLAGIRDWTPYDTFWASVVPTPTLPELRLWCEQHGMPLIAMMWPVLQDLGDNGWNPFRRQLDVMLAAHPDLSDGMRALMHGRGFGPSAGG